MQSAAPYSPKAPMKIHAPPQIRCDAGCAFGRRSDMAREHKFHTSDEPTPKTHGQAHSTVFAPAHIGTFNRASDHFSLHHASTWMRLINTLCSNTDHSTPHNSPSASCQSILNSRQKVSSKAKFIILPLTRTTTVCPTGGAHLIRDISSLPMVSD